MAKKKKGKKAIAMPSPVDTMGAFGRVTDHKAAAALVARGWWVRRHLDDGRVYVQGDQHVSEEEGKAEGVDTEADTEADAEGATEAEGADDLPAD